jgi:hypothetical protein
MDSYESRLKPYVCTCITIGNPCVLHSPPWQNTLGVMIINLEMKALSLIEKSMGVDFDYV